MILAAMAFPQASYAREIDYLHSFGNGLQTLTEGTENERVTPERNYQEGYVPELHQVETVRAEDGPPNLMQQISGFVESIQAPWGASSYAPRNWYYFARLVLLQVVPIAVLFVFVWWGLRKSMSIIMHAFRTGRLNLGTRVKRAYYRRKAREWYG